MKPSQLKKLAKACREAGIKHFKNAEIEFTLSDNWEVKSVKPAVTPRESDKPIESDELSPEAMLFWSTGEDYSNEPKETN